MLDSEKDQAAPQGETAGTSPSMCDRVASDAPHSLARDERKNEYWQAHSARERGAEYREKTVEPARHGRANNDPVVALILPWRQEAALLKDCISVSKGWGPFELRNLSAITMDQDTGRHLFECRFHYHGSEGDFDRSTRNLIDCVSHISRPISISRENVA